MNIICIGLGKNIGHDIRIEHTVILAKTLVYNDFYLFYGGVDIGLTGVLTNAGQAQKGRFSSVIPSWIVSVDGPAGQGTLIAAKDNRERVQHITKLADTFMAQPGGYGRHADIFTLLTRAQLNPHGEPVAFFTLHDFCHHIDFWSFSKLV